MKHLLLVILLTCATLAQGEPINIAENGIGIDVRTKAELWINPSINSTHIPISDLSEQIGQVVPDKNTPIYLFCQSGGRSAKGLQQLESLGYTQIIDVKTWRRWNELNQSNKLAESTH